MRRISSPALVVIVVVSALIGGASVALASHQFSDVGESHPFHDEIGAVAGAGIALGFGDGTYRPSNTVTRQAMAAFFERGVGRAGQGTGDVTLFQDSIGVVAEVMVRSGARGAGTGFVLLNGNATAGTAAPASCPCPVSLGIEGSTNYTVFEIPSIATGSGTGYGAGSISAVLPIAADTTRTFRMTAQLGESASGGPNVAVSGHLTAMYVPLSADGDDTLASELSCPQDDGYEPNDNRGQATSLYDGAGYASNGIVCPSDEDWFTFGTVTTGEEMSVQANFANVQGNIDICVTNESGSHTVCSTTSNNLESVIVSPPADDVYYVRVYLESDAGAPGNTYSLQGFVFPLA